jgi:hypothetical protein
LPPPEHPEITTKRSTGRSYQRSASRCVLAAALWQLGLAPACPNSHHFLSRHGSRLSRSDSIGRLRDCGAPRAHVRCSCTQCRNLTGVRPPGRWIRPPAPSVTRSQRLRFSAPTPPCTTIAAVAPISGASRSRSRRSTTFRFFATSTGDRFPTRKRRLTRRDERTHRSQPAPARHGQLGPTRAPRRPLPQAVGEGSTAHADYRPAGRCASRVSAAGRSREVLMDAAPKARSPR